jgi:cobyrinic acid a,c-diamide synthase
VKGLLVAGTASGVGKTTVSLAIMAGFRRHGRTVQPFKCGPDFLDTGHHTLVCGRVARNLDTWMLSAEANWDVLRDASRDADAVVAEGMMGLFDGKSGDAETGSSAEIAKLLKLPVVLVVDAAKSARSIAAVVLGFESFDTDLQLAGVILNRVGSERHFKMLETAINASCKTKILGWLPSEPRISIPERHLGLYGATESAAMEINTLAELAETHLDLDALSRLQCGLGSTNGTQVACTEVGEKVRIGVACDQAFSFYYEDNFDLLRKHGAEIVPFSPMNDACLPHDLDALYLGGGYPELYVEQLSQNRPMLEEVHAFAASGRPVYAECGGMLYLSRALKVADGTIHPMAGVLPLSMEMTDRLVQFGYATVEFTEDCLLGRQGVVVRGHSFHYSRVASKQEIETSYRVQYSLSGKEELEGFHQGNVLASYIHLHFRANPTVSEHFVSSVRAAKSLRMVTA